MTAAYQYVLSRVFPCATEHGFTLFERHLMLSDVSANFGTAYFVYLVRLKQGWVTMNFFGWTLLALDLL